ncbi:glycosyltransferase [Dactylosporangium darangshiense]
MSSIEAFSVVVPTWNEARLLPPLVRALQASPSVGEVIVADAESEDGTAQVAVAAGARVVAGGRPAHGRNAGARVAHRSLLLFLDADVQPTPEVLSQLAAGFADPAVNAMHVRLMPLSGSWFVRLCYRMLDRHFQVCDRLGLPQGLGALVAVRREAFDRVGGFDETVVAGEDSHFFRQLGRLVGGVVYRRELSIGVSARRFEMESPALFALKNILWGALRLAGLRISIVPYRWQRYP